MKKIFVFTVFLIIFAFWSNAAYAEYSWEKASMDSSSKIYISPSYEQDLTLFLLSNQALYRSLDEGKTWLKISTAPVWHIQFSHDKSLFTLQGINERDLSIFKYQPSQVHWEKVCKAPDNTKVFAVLPNGNIIIVKTYDFSSLRQMLLTYDNGLSWNDTMFNQSGDILETTPDGYLFTRNNETFFGARSTDFGQKWKGLSKTYEINQFFVSPSYNEDNTLFAIMNQRSVYRSPDKGDYWAKTMAGMEDNVKLSDLAFSVHYSKDKTMYCADEDGRIYISRNGAGDWST